MRRFELEAEGSKKFWQVSSEGATLTVSYGRIGTAGQTKVKVLASSEAAEKEAAKLVREKTAKGYLEVADMRAAAPSATRPAAVADFEDIPGSTLREMATKLAKVRSEDPLSYEQLLFRSVSQERMGAVLWHLVDLGWIVPEENTGYLLLLAKYASDASTDSLFALLARIPASFPPPRPAEVLPGWPERLDRLAVEAVRRAPERVLALLATLPSNVRLGLQLVRGRSGMTVLGDGPDVLRGLARMQAEGGGLVHVLLHREMLCVRGDELAPLAIETPADVRQLALLFGTEDQWQSELLRAVRLERWSSIGAVADALRVLPLSELVELPTSQWGTSFDDEELFALLAARDDGPEAIFDALDALEPDPRPADNAMRDKLRVFAFVTLAERGQPIPEGAEAGLLSLPFVYAGFNKRAIVLREWCDRAIRALPRERAAALVARMVAKLPGIEPEVAHLLDGAS